MSNELRKAALELVSTDINDTVKIAGVVRRIKNWWKALSNPEYRKQVGKLKEESEYVQHLSKQLDEELKNLQKAINDSDVSAYGESVQNVRDLSLQLGTELGKLEQASTTAISTAPEELKYVTKEMLKDKETREKLTRQLPAGYDISVGKVGAPAQDFNWMRQFSPDDVQLKPDPANKIKKDLVKVIERDLGINESESTSLIENTWAEIYDNIQKAILDGRINKVEHSSVSEQVPKRPANQMKMFMSAFNINIPGTDIVFDLPSIVVVDLYASMTPSKKLSVYWTSNIRSSPKKASLTKSFIKTAAKYDKVAAIPGLEKKSPEFIRELINIGNRLNIKPGFLASVMLAESGLDPSAVNPKGGATGLIQFMPNSARKLGTSPEELANMSDTQQLYYVEKYYEPFSGRIRTPGDLYMATFLPVFVGKGGNTIIAQKGNEESVPGTNLTYDVIYRYNKGFDSDQDGVIRAKDVTSNANNIYYSGVSNGYITLDDLEKKKYYAEEEEEEHIDEEVQEKLMDDYKELLSALTASGPVESLVKNSIREKPSKNILLSFPATDYELNVCCAKILSSALREELGAKTSICSNNKQVELECESYNSDLNNLAKKISKFVVSEFNKKAGSNIKSPIIYDNLNSSYKILSANKINRYFRNLSLKKINR